MTQPNDSTKAVKLYNYAIEVLKLPFGQGNWYSCEISLNGQLRVGFGHWSKKEFRAQMEDHLKRYPMKGV